MPKQIVCAAPPGSLRGRFCRGQGCIFIRSKDGWVGGWVKYTGSMCPLCSVHSHPPTRFIRINLQSTTKNRIDWHPTTPPHLQRSTIPTRHPSILAVVDDIATFTIGTKRERKGNRKANKKRNGKRKTKRNEKENVTKMKRNLFASHYPPPSPKKYHHDTTSKHYCRHRRHRHLHHRNETRTKRKQKTKRKTKNEMK